MEFRGGLGGLDSCLASISAGLMAADNPGISSAKVLLVQPISPTHPLDASFLLQPDLYYQFTIALTSL